MLHQFNIFAEVFPNIYQKLDSVIPKVRFSTCNVYFFENEQYANSEIPALL